MKHLRLTALLACLILVLTALSGCGNGETEDTRQTAQTGTNTAAADEMVYAATYHTLDDGFEAYNPVVVVDGSIYSVSYGVVGTREPTEAELRDYPNEDWIYEKYGSYLVKMNLTDNTTTKLSGYTSVEPEIPEDRKSTTTASSYPSGMAAGADNTLWVLETLTVSTQTNEYDYSYTETYYLRRLDLEGRELQRAELDFIGSGKTLEYLNGFAADADGYFYFCGESSVVVAGSDAKQKFVVPVNGWVNGSVRLADGRVAINIYDTNTYTQSLQIINAETGTMDRQTISTPENMYNMYDGVGDYLFLSDDGSCLYGYSAESGEYETLLNWIDCDINRNFVEKIVQLADGELGVLLHEWGTNEIRSYLVSLKKIPADQAPQRTVLTLGTNGTDMMLSSTIINFNRQSNQYRIMVKDYGSGDAGGEDQLKTDIITGNAPDLIDVSSGINTELLIRKNLLEDLTPYLDAEPELKSQLLDCYINAASVDGRLYQVYPDFSVCTVGALTSTVGDKTGWSWEDIEALQQVNPDVPLFGGSVTRSSILTQLAVFCLDRFVDWQNATCDFQNAEFESMLEFAGRFPAESDANGSDEWTSVMNGEQLLLLMQISTFDEISQYESLFGGEITYIGLPGASGNGTAITACGSGYVMSSASRNKEGCWEFLKMLLSEEYQTGAFSWNEFHTNRLALEEAIQKHLDSIRYDADGNPESNGGIGWGEDSMLEIYPATQKQIDALFAVAEKATTGYSYDSDILNIIQEEAEAYFAGQRSVSETTAVIQGRAAIYISEQS